MHEMKVRKENRGRSRGVHFKMEEYSGYKEIDSAEGTRNRPGK